ncbi:MAG: reductive dehalogenase domain-containing protein [Dehalococcoidia bacterium]|nr:reductive dehalogenase domain-containing protein [Dehalococcoidia bacterium]MDP7082998.1 reductive dehalogenase domain-containing protein [Dehalococcoidia bacterium]MDP7511846.1 reductive dehalogenase domain-containing protein [Dehalococcoidia bacterium]HJN88130.1 reductive dehalogenase domain-containing protein [Dehalococcoidia bacterium]
MPRVAHTVTRPGKNLGDPETIIPVAEDLVTVPGVRQRPEEVDWYTVEYPLESHNVENRSYRQWVDTVTAIRGLRREHETLNRPWVTGARASGDLAPTATPVPEKDVTQQIKQKAREVGYHEVGMTAFDLRYVFSSKRDKVNYDLPHAICLVMEQPYEDTQSAPSGPAEAAALATYRKEGEAGIELAAFIRSLGYRAQVHSPNDAICANIPMHVAAGLGQQGANGQLLSPYFGSRARIMLIATDALVTYDEPVDYGIHAFCQVCQVCVNRCPGRALQKEKVWWRGVEKNKLIAKRCRPVMGRYAACGICQKVCPIQKYGMKEVMEHYVETGEVKGKGTDELEGYTLPDMGFFASGELPRFDPEFFQIPEGRLEEWVVKQLKEKLAEGVQDDTKLAEEYGKHLVRAVRRPADFMEELYFTPEVTEALPSREFFEDEPEFEEDL